MSLRHHMVPALMLCALALPWACGESSSDGVPAVNLPQAGPTYSTPVSYPRGGQPAWTLPASDSHHRSLARIWVLPCAPSGPSVGRGCCGATRSRHPAVGTRARQERGRMHLRLHARRQPDVRRDRGAARLRRPARLSAGRRPIAPTTAGPRTSRAPDAALRAASRPNRHPARCSTPLAAVIEPIANGRPRPAQAARTRASAPASRSASRRKTAPRCDCPRRTIAIRVRSSRSTVRPGACWSSPACRAVPRSRTPPRALRRS